MYIHFNQCGSLTTYTRTKTLLIQIEDPSAVRPRTGKTQGKAATRGVDLPFTAGQSLKVTRYRHISAPVFQRHVRAHSSRQDLRSLAVREIISVGK
jgi:hypothetical protein